MNAIRYNDFYNNEFFWFSDEGLLGFKYVSKIEICRGKFKMTYRLWKEVVGGINLIFLDKNELEFNINRNGSMLPIIQMTRFSIIKIN